MRRLLPVAATALLVAVCFVACDGQPPIQIASDGGVVTGSLQGAVVKGLVSGATVTVNRFVDGKIGIQAGTTTTNDAGAFTVTVGGAQGALLLDATGGRYTEEATGDVVGLGQRDLQAFVPDFQVGSAVQNVQVNPVTTLTAAYTRWRMRALHESFTTAEASAKALIEAHFGGLDWATTLPEDVTTQKSVALTDPVIAGLLLSGLSYEGRLEDEKLSLPGNTINAAVLTHALAEDIEADGFFDGKGENGVQITVQGYDLSGDTLRDQLAVAIVRFLGSKRNATQLGRQDVRALLDKMATDGPLPGTRARPGKDIFRTPSSLPPLDPPTVTFEVPAEGAGVRGEVTVTAKASDAASKITSFTFTAPTVGLTPKAPVGLGTKQVSLTGALNAGAFPDGPLTLTATATDAAGYTTTATRKVVVANNAPTITVTAPAPGDHIKGTVTIQASASPSSGSGGAVTSLVVTAPTGLIDADPSASTLSASWDTTQMPEGPYTITLKATDEYGSVGSAQVPVVVDNRPAPVITGQVVVAGQPVENPKIIVYALGTRSTASPEGTVIGTADGDQSGVFSVTITDEAYQGPIRVVATKTDTAGKTTRYLDPLASKEVVLASGDELALYLPDVISAKGSPGWSSVYITPWTTIASSLAIYYLDRTSNPLSPASAASTAEDMIGGHFHRAQPFSLLYDAPLDLTSGAVTLSAAYPGLADIGLTQMARMFAKNAGVTPGTTVTALTLAEALAEDLHDGVFDGRDTGVRLIVAGQPLQVNTTRASLAYQIDAFINSSANASGLTSQDLKAAGFYDDLANDSRSIYPASSPPPPFDTTPPVITWTSPATADSNAGDTSVALDISATDPLPDASGLAQFYILSPPSLRGMDTDGQLNRIRYTVDNTVAPNDGYYVAIKAFAEDNVGLTTTSTMRFTRPAPTAHIDSVTKQPSGAAVTGPVSGPFRIVASATRGFATQSFVLVPPADASTGAVGPDQAGTSTDLNIVVDVDPTGGKIPDGTQTFKVVHDAIDGRSATDAVTLTLDNTPPTVSATLQQPYTVVGSDDWLTASGTSSAGAPVATASFKYTVQDATAGIQKVELLNAGTVLATAVPGACKAASCAGSISADLSEGDYTLLVRATDGAGNVATTTPVSVRVDTTPPTFTTGPTFDSPGQVAAGTGFWLPRAGTDATGAYAKALFDFAVQDSPSGVAKVVLTATGTQTATGPVTLSQTEAFGGCVASPCTGQLALKLRGGSYTLSLQALDQAGNVTTSKSWSVQVDTTGPTFTPTLTNAHTVGSISWVGDDGSHVTGSPSFGYSVQDDSSGITKVQIVATQTGAGTSETATKTYAGGCVAAACASQTLSVPLVEGTYDVHLEATDEAGNVTRSSIWTVYVDVQKPTATDQTGSTSFADPRDLDFVRTSTGYGYPARPAATSFSANAASVAIAGTPTWWKFEQRLAGKTVADAAVGASNLPVFYISAADAPGNPSTQAQSLEVDYRYEWSTNNATWQVGRDWTPATPVGASAPDTYFVVASTDMLSPSLDQDGAYHKVIFRVRDEALNEATQTFVFRLHLLPAPVAVQVDTKYESHGASDPDSLYARSFAAGNVSCVFSACSPQDLDSSLTFRVAHATVYQPFAGHTAVMELHLGQSVLLDRTLRQRPLVQSVVADVCTKQATYQTQSGTFASCQVQRTPDPSHDDPPCLTKWGDPARKVVWKNLDQTTDAYAGCREDSSTSAASFPVVSYLRDDGGVLVNSGYAAKINAIVVNRSTSTLVASSSVSGSVYTYQLPMGTYDVYYRIPLEGGITPAFLSTTRTDLDPSTGTFNAYGEKLQDQERWKADVVSSPDQVTSHVGPSGSLYQTCDATATSCTGWSTTTEHVIRYEDKLVWYGDQGSAANTASFIAVNITNATTTVPAQRDPSTAQALDDASGAEKYGIYHSLTETGN